MHRKSAAMAAIGFVLHFTLVAGPAAAESEPGGAVFDFEQEQLASSWSTTAKGASLTITHEPANVRTGRGALQLSWMPSSGRLAILTVSPVCLESRARSLVLSVKLEQPSPLMYGVEESDGSSYQGYMYTPGGRWHDLAVDLDELMLSESSTDENGRLDVDEVCGIMVADLSNLPGEAGKSIGLKEGQQYLWLDDVRLTDELAPHRSYRGAEGEMIIDDFEREPILCLPLGGPRLSLSEGPDDQDASALSIAYDQQHYRWAGFVGALGYLNLARCTEICLHLRAMNAAPLIVVLEERDGSKYASHVRLDPENGWHTVRLPFEGFELDPDTVDENDRMDLDQLRVIIPVVDTKRAEIGESEIGSWLLSRLWCR